MKRIRISRAFIAALLTAVASVFTAEDPRDPHVIGTAAAIIAAAVSGGARKRDERTRTRANDDE